MYDEFHAKCCDNGTFSHVESCGCSTSPQLCGEPPLLTNFTIRAVYAAIIDYYFQPPTVELKLLQYGFKKESLRKVYNLPFVTTIETKLQIFHYKISHNILRARRSLFRMKLSDSEICQLCKMQPQKSLTYFPLFCNFQFLVCVSKLVVGKK